MITDGVIALRPPEAADREALIALRDDQFRRFIGQGSPEPRPTCCIVIGDEVVGWVDADEPGQHEWLTADELNMGYALHPDHRGGGYATRAVMLLLHHLSQAPPCSTATLAIDFDNHASLAIAARCGFQRVADLPDSTHWKKPIPPQTYTDGVVTIRPLRRNGPRWTFVVDVDGQDVGRVDCDLASDDVPHGEANIECWTSDERGDGSVSRAVALSLQFLLEHTGAREARIGDRDRITLRR